MTKILACCLLLFCANARPADLITGHVDIRFNYLPATGTWTCLLRYGGTFDNPSIEADPETVALPARDFLSTASGDRYLQPASAAYAFTGAATGSPLWILPQTDRGYTWPGFANVQTVGTFLSYLNSDPRVNATAKWLKIRLVSVEYSGAATGLPQFSLWTTGSGGTPTVWMATSDGIGPTDCYFTTENTHSHLNWGFTALGIYRVSMRSSACLASDSTFVEGTDQTVTFAIGTLATWRATHFSGADIVTLGDPLSDPDSDGSSNLIEYAFNTDPNVPGTTVMVAGTGTAGLPLVRVENVGGQDRLTVEFVRRKASSNPQITYTPEFSSTLAAGDWQAVGTTTVTPIDATWERVKVTDAVPTGTRRFARVRISLQSTITY
ncbi:MAG: choice-of-anchor M domain-containing protein [Terrimicrobiaceae bacterium]